MQRNTPLFLKTISVLSLGVASVMLLSACAKKTEVTTLNIGYQKYGLLPIIKIRGDLDKALKQQGIKIKWVEFPAGPQLLEGLNVGSVSLGEAGEAPPNFRTGSQCRFGIYRESASSASGRSIDCSAKFNH